jgi:hypothetical protein
MEKKSIEDLRLRVRALEGMAHHHPAICRPRQKKIYNI